MRLNCNHLVTSGVMLLGMSLVSMASYAAQPINLSDQKPSFLQNFSSYAATPGHIGIQETSRSVDVKNNLHVRVQETYMNYPVWGGDAVVHTANNTAKGNMLFATAKSMDGTFYQNLDGDLANTPAVVFTEAQAQKALQQTIVNFEHKRGGKTEITNQESKLMVYVDDTNKAHWAYKISFYAPALKTGDLPSQPITIVDAVTGKVYMQWDNIQSHHKHRHDKSSELGGGNGGNLKMGEVIYDGIKGDLDDFTVQREATDNTCFLRNDDVTVVSVKTNQVVSFECKVKDADHNNIYWDGELEAVNGGYSPDNDAFFGGKVIKNMYQDWYGVPVLTDADGKPMMLKMVVHARMDNAYWDGSKMTFGDGISMFYPLTSLGVAAHEISHGFTQQHSNLTYSGQSGGMNEAFSDMAAQAAEYFAYGKNSWQIGPEIFKRENQALRYMDQPSKDCNGRQPGNWCSIDDASQYNRGLDVHYSSGVYNRVFYLLGTSKNWNAKKAFNVMVQANSNYWTSSTTFETGACGVLKATKDLGYALKPVYKAFKTVKVDTSNCKLA